MLPYFSVKYVTAAFEFLNDETGKAVENTEVFLVADSRLSKGL